MVIISVRGRRLFKVEDQFQKDTFWDFYGKRQDVHKKYESIQKYSGACLGNITELAAEVSTHITERSHRNNAKVCATQIPGRKEETLTDDLWSEETKFRSSLQLFTYGSNVYPSHPSARHRDGLT